MKRLISFTLILLLLLIACSNKVSAPKEQNHKKELDRSTFVTKDGKITFRIFNTAKLPEEKVESIKSKILYGYMNIKYHSIKTDYIPSNKINIFLLKGNETSWGLKDEIKLYFPTSWDDKTQIVHELTHTLLGYGNNFEVSPSQGYLTQEGYATYMEDKYGKLKLPSHKIMKYFIDSHRNIPLFKLTNINTDDSLFRSSPINQESVILRWMSYIHATSFVSYLIETYGSERFEKVYNQDNLDNKLEEVYGKDTNELEKEWLGFIEQTQSELTDDDKMKIDNFYYIKPVLDQLDPKIFIRK